MSGIVLVNLNGKFWNFRRERKIKEQSQSFKFLFKSDTMHNGEFLYWGLTNLTISLVGVSLCLH